MCMCVWVNRNRNNLVMWFVLLGPAVFLAGDFFFISAFCKNSIVDTVHYATIFLWVLGTLCTFFVGVG